MIAENEKYLQKMLKKICRYRNLLYLCNQKQQNKVKLLKVKAMETILAIRAFLIFSGVLTAIVSIAATIFAVYACTKED